MGSVIALVDDDQNILTSVSMALEEEGFSVQTFINGEEAIKGLLDDLPDLIVLDIKMPRMNGMDVLKRIRNRSDVPVIFLTSRDDEIDELLGLKMGADDYITKPFSQRLLIERIRTILRRHQLMKGEDKEEEKEGDIYTVGKLTLNSERYTAHWKKKPLDITVTEYLLIECLAKNPGHVKSRAQLVDYACGDESYTDDRAVDSHVKRIRYKFKEIDKKFDQIDTVYGIGYRYKDG